MSGPRILIVDDDPHIGQMLDEFLRDEGFQPIVVDSARGATAAVRRELPDLVLLDMRLSDGNGLELLKTHLLPELGRYKVIMLSAFASQKDAEEAVQAGAFDYVTKPVSLPKLAITIRNCLHLQTLMRELADLGGDGAAAASLGDIVGMSPAILELTEQLKRVAPYDVPVLILGESGTGKELVARVLHALSGRRHAPFVPLDCGAIPQELVESELFGHEAGAFTGASQSKPGRMERAQGGTLLLDEVGNLPIGIQAKFLRVLQFKEFDRLGGREVIKADVRVVAATNANLEAMVAEGTFRRDLYYRLNAVILRVPALRERREDIPLLAHLLLMRANRAYKTKVQGISAQALRLMEEYPWPGNIRELENAIRAAVIVADRIIRPTHLPAHVRRVLESGVNASGAQEDGDDLSPLRSWESGNLSLAQIGRMAAEAAQRRAVTRMLEETGWNKAEAARRLQIDYKALHVKLQRWGIHPPGKKK
ncbi:acetoacetate metabolism regulatory protein AtoC [Nitrospira sp.]|nr:acetoacetate metabolism regulatory protein AtoC [Nitrospira sp.]